MAAGGQNSCHERGNRLSCFSCPSWLVFFSWEALSPLRAWAISQSPCTANSKYCSLQKMSIQFFIFAGRHTNQPRRHSRLAAFISTYLSGLIYFGSVCRLFNPHQSRLNRLRPEIIPCELHKAENRSTHNNLTDFQIPEKLLHSSFP